MQRAVLMQPAAEGGIWRGIALGLTALALAVYPYLGQSAGRARPSNGHGDARETSAANAAREEPALSRTPEQSSAPTAVGGPAALETLIAMAQRDDMTAASNALQSIGQI